MVDALSREPLSALSSPGSNPVPAAQALYQQVMQPLIAKLGLVRELYLSLDGTLARTICWGGLAFTT